jgi:hypothetical protein
LIDALRYNGSLTDFRERAEPLTSPSPDTAARDEKRGPPPCGLDDRKSMR